MTDTTIVDSVTLHGGPAETFPPVEGRPAVLVDTNLGWGMTSEDMKLAVGHLLRRLAHALEQGAAIDLTTPTGGAS